MFLLGAVYILLDTYITVRLRSSVKNGVMLTCVRLVIACLTAIFIILCILEYLPRQYLNIHIVLYKPTVTLNKN